MGLTEERVTKLRHESVRSNVEAKDPSGFKRKIKQYQEPTLLNTVLTQIPNNADERIVPLLKGYFQDMYLSLLEVSRILRNGGHVAYVLAMFGMQES